MSARIGRAVFLAGSLGAAFFLVEQPDTVRWLPFGIAVGVAVFGVIVVRWASAGGGDGTTRDAAVAEALDAMVSWTRSAGSSPADLELSRRIDREVRPYLRRVEHSLDALHERLGPKSYAQFMDPYARGERALNRVWSAAADGYADEARHQLAVTEAAWTQAAERLGAAKPE